MPTTAFNRLESLRTLRVANLDGAFAQAFLTLTSGAFLVGFVKYLGGSDLWIGLLSALPNLVGILQIPGGVVGRRFESYKRFVAPGGLTWRLLYIPLIFLPFLPLNHALILAVLSICVGLGWAANTFVAPVYSEWLGEVVPPESRGFYFSRRNAIMAATGAVVGISGGLALDWFRSQNSEPLGYSVVFGIGLVCAAISMGLFFRMADLRRATTARRRLREEISALKLPFADKGFRSVLVFIAMFVLGQMFAGNFFAAYALEVLDMPFTLLQSLTLVHAAGNVATAPAWGFICDKYGNKPALFIAALGVTITPLPWLLAVPGEHLRNAIVLFLLHILSGSMWAGATVAQLNLVLATSKPEERSTYIGSALATQAIVGGLSPLLGGVVMEGLRGFVSAQAAYGWLFVGTSLLRGLSAIGLMPVRESGAAQIGRTFRELRQITPRGYRAMRELARSADEASREHAIESVGDEHLALATDQIVKALHDPSPRVRRRASSSLAKLKNPEATQALIHQLVDHPDLVEEETVHALGEIGDPASIPHLIKLLESPRPILRRSAAKALGTIGGMDSVAALTGAAAEHGDPDLRRAALQALRQIGAVGAAHVVADALLDSAPSVRIAASEAVAELHLESARANLIESLRRYQDEASAEAAYALGAVGDETDVLLILQAADRSTSMITRRRCLLGLARLLDVERETYRILLQEGLARDAALLEVLRPVTRAKPRTRAALDRYSSGDEPGALAALKSAIHTEPFEQMAVHPVSELFVVAACAAAKRLRS